MAIMGILILELVKFAIQHVPLAQAVYNQPVKAVMMDFYFSALLVSLHVLTATLMIQLIDFAKL
jgi:hypothetical protein